MPPTRFLRPLEVAARPSSQTASVLYVCSTCRRQCRPAAAAVSLCPQTLRQASSNASFTEKLRRKVWGTDNPPGLKDPYGGESLLERKLREKGLRKEEADAAVEEAEAEAASEHETAAPEQESVSPTAVEDPDYVPATSWEGLPVVGRTQKLWENQPGEKDMYWSFMNLDRMLDRNDLLRTIRGVAVELLVFHATNRPLDSICSHEHFIDLLSQVVVKPTPTGPTLEYPSEDVKRELLARFEGGSVEQQEASEAPANPTDMDFLDVSLADPAFKFAFVKRISQLTGHRIPDHELGGLSTLGRLARFLEKASAPKPKKLAEVLLADERLTSLPNVKISARKVGSIDRERESGRWKVIEEELVRRRLPVMGRAQE